MMKPQPVYDEDGNVVAMAKPIPLWAIAAGHAAIEIGPFILAGEVGPRAFRAGKARYRRGKIGTRLTGDRIDAAVLSKQSQVDLAKHKAKTAKELMNEAEAKLAAQGETPLPTSENTTGPSVIDYKTGNEYFDFSNPETGQMGLPLKEKFKLQQEPMESPVPAEKVAKAAEKEVDYSRRQAGEEPAPVSEHVPDLPKAHDPVQARKGREARKKADTPKGLHTGGVYRNLGRRLKGIWDEATQKTINNASGESAASYEALKRLASQEDMIFFRIDGKKPNVLEPIALTVDLADLSAGNGKVILGKKIGDPRLIIMDSGADLSVAATRRMVNNWQRRANKATLADYSLDRLFANGGYEMASKAMSDTLRKLSDNQIINAVEDFFYIEPRFTRLGAEETAFHMKNANSFSSAVMREGAAKLIEQAEKVGYDPKVLKDAVLIAESKKLLAEKAGTPAGDLAAWMRKEFDAALKRLNQEGVMVNFKERIGRKITQKLKDAIEVNQANPTAETRADVVKYRNALEKLQDFEFVSIPKSMWFEELLSAPKTENKALRILNSKERRILSIGDMEPFLGDKISAMDVMGNYFYKLGNDLAVGKIINAALEEGMATKSRKLATELNFERISAADAPAFADYYMHPTLRATLQNEFITRVNPSMINQVTSLTKMMTFDSPWFLGYYNLIQAAWLRGPHHIPGIIMDSVKAYKQIKNMHPEFRMALENGLQSTPYPQPFETTLKTVQEMHKGLPKRALEVITENTPGKMMHKAKHGKKLGRLPVIPEFYALAWDTAWNMFDLPVRMGTYNWLRKKGYNPRQSAQTAALYHGDYAAIPRSTRVMLNKMLYTPTFKIAMAKLHGKMIRGTVPEIFGQQKGPHQFLKRGTAVKSAMYWWMTNQAFDTWLTHGMGFQQESWGRRYSKMVETEDGMSKMFVTLAHPMNLLPKYGEKLAKIWEKGNPGAVMRAFTQLKYDMTPLLTIGMGALENKGIGGQPITNTYDNLRTKARKVAKFGVTQISSWAQKAFPSNEDRKTKKAFYDEVGFGLAFFLDTISNQYLGSTKDEKLIRDLERARRSLYQDLYRTLDRDDLSDENFNELLDNFGKHIDNLMEE
ncbi:MAG: hypothetical protein ACXABY_10410 [Candidatus Thorarchaeota archaeon]|jgi:hypothetical protein